MTSAVYLPRHEGAAPVKATSHARSRQRSGKETVLVVDDEGPIRRLSARVLHGEGYTVLQAEDGVAAMKQMAKHGRKIAMVVTDIVMPRMDGYQLMERIRRSCPELPIIVMSEFSHGSLADQIAQGGDLTLTEKPFSPDSLPNAVRVALEGPVAERETA